MRKPVATGSFIISLDFELYWGWHDRFALSEIKSSIDATWITIPRLLALFEEFGLHATWAVVGLLMHDGKSDAISNLPDTLPLYADDTLSPYAHLQTRDSGNGDPTHFAGSLVKQIRDTPHQEIGSHTFSHIYCLEPGMTPEAFRADLIAASRVAKRFLVPVRSIVFPRNQVNKQYLDICREQGIAAYRGTEKTWPYKPIASSKLSPMRRAVRLADSYCNITGHHTFKIAVEPNGIADVRASRYFRPYMKRLSLLEPLKTRRIMSAMQSAAVNGRAFHLWWHPEDFALNLRENLDQLQEIGQHFASLQSKYGMRSLTMVEAAESAR